MIPHFQSTTFTTAAASLLTIMHYLNNNIKLSKDHEFAIWHKSVNLPTRGSSIYALATYAKEQGLSPTVIVEQKEYSFPDYRFYRYTKEDIEHATFSEKKHLEKAEGANIPIEERTITLDEIQTHLQENKIILLRINTKPFNNIKKNTSNYIVVHGYENNHFHIVNPAHTALSVPKEIMQEAFDTLETKKYRDHRMIIF
jgi:hypothetical protein